MAGEPAVHLEGAVRRFGSRAAIDGVGFTVHRGEVFGLLGHNGAGKTTLIRVINGLLPLDRGGVTTLGLDPIRMGSQVRQRVGVLTEYPALDDFLTPVENLLVYAAVYGVPPGSVHERASRLIDRLGLGEHAHLPARSLSAGMKQRLALARALVHDPELVLLDEPTSNLDPLAAREVRELVRELSHDLGRTVVLSTHNLVEAQELCDRVAIIQRGHLLAVGTLDELGRDLDRGVVHFRFEDRVPEHAGDMLRPYGGSLAPTPAPRTLAVRMPRAAVPDLLHALVSAGRRIEAVEPQTPTLEDVYVSLHGHTSVGGSS